MTLGELKLAIHQTITLDLKYQPYEMFNLHFPTCTTVDLKR